jgi:hypothetical protein
MNEKFEGDDVTVVTVAAWWAYDQQCSIEVTGCSLAHAPCSCMLSSSGGAVAHVGSGGMLQNWLSEMMCARLVAKLH